MGEKTPPVNDKTWNSKIEGANPESVDVDIPEQGEPEERDRSRMAEPTPPERVIPRRAKDDRNAQGAGPEQDDEQRRDE